MRNIFLLGDGINAIYVLDNIEYKLKFGLLKIEEYLLSYSKIKSLYQVIKPDSSKCKARLYFDQNYQIYANINEQRVFYKEDVSLTKYDILVVYDNVLPIYDKVDLCATKDFLKIMKISSHTLGEIIKRGKISNALLFMDKVCLEENGIFINTSDPIEIYKILRRIPNLESAVFVINNYYFLLENNDFTILFHDEQKTIIGNLEILVSGFIMFYEYSFIEALKMGIKMSYFYNERGLINREDVIKDTLKKDIDIHQININKASEIKGLYKDDYKSAKNIVRYGNDAINVPFYSYKSVTLIDFKIINEHKELLKILSKKNLSILINGTNSFSYVKDYFEEKIYENINNLEEIILITRNENILNKRAVFYFETIDEELKNELLKGLKKGLFKRENHEYLINKMTVIFTNQSNVEEYDISIEKPSLNTKIERAIFLRKELEKRNFTFKDKECQIADEVLNIFLNGNLYFEENSIIKVLNLTDFNNDVLSLNSLPSKSILEKFIDIRIDNEMVEKLSNKLNIETQNKERSLSYASTILEAMEEKKIHYRLANNPLDFIFTDSEIDYLAMHKVMKDETDWSFLDEKEKSKERSIIKKLPKFFKELGYELFLF